MLLGGIAGSVLPGIGSIISQNMANKQSVRNTEMTYQKNRELADYQYGRDLDMWNKSNAYNSPSAQMQRLKEAGLNPNLVYGNGSPAGATAQQIPKYQAPQVSYNAPPPGSPGQLMQVDILGQFQDYRVKQATIDNLRAQKKATEQATENAVTSGKILGERLPGESYRSQLLQNQWKFAEGTIEQRIAEALAKAQLTQDLAPFQLQLAEGKVRNLETANNVMIGNLNLKRKSTNQSIVESGARINKMNAERNLAIGRTGMLPVEKAKIEQQTEYGKAMKSLKDLEIDWYTEKMWVDLITKSVGAGKGIIDSILKFRGGNKKNTPTWDWRKYDEQFKQK